MHGKDTPPCKIGLKKSSTASTFVLNQMKNIQSNDWSTSSYLVVVTAMGILYIGDIPIYNPPG